MKRNNLERRLRRPVTALAAFVMAVAMTQPAAGREQTEAAVPNPKVTPIAMDVGVPVGPILAAPVDLSLYGYTEAEFELAGTANTYSESGTWSSDGHWAVKVASDDHPYVTRILVRRPLNAQKFNGTVVVEWLNVTSGYDLDVDWPQSYTEFLRDGFAWVGVSAQRVGVDSLARINPERYGNLSIESDDNSYDIFSQAAQAIRQQPWLVLGGLHPKRIVATGQSQSAIRLVTYTDAIQPIANVFDALLIHSRSSGAGPISGFKLPPSVSYIRDDLKVPVLQLESQTDVTELQFYKARQADTAKLRSWEVAGTSHIDSTFMVSSNTEAAASLGTPEVSCVNQVNSAPFHYVESAAWAAMQSWMTGSAQPATSPQIEVDSKGKVQLDQHGNAIGGIRLPELEAPVAQYTISNFGRAKANVPNGLDFLGCSLFGSTLPFSSKTLNGLYTSHDDYVSRYQQAAQALVDAGFMLPADQALAVLRAQQSNIGGH